MLQSESSNDMPFGKFGDVGSRNRYLGNDQVITFHKIVWDVII